MFFLNQRFLDGTYLYARSIEEVVNASCVQNFCFSYRQVIVLSIDFIPQGLMTSTFPFIYSCHCLILITLPGLQLFRLPTPFSFRRKPVLPSYCCNCMRWYTVLGSCSLPRGDWFGIYFQRVELLLNTLSMLCRLQICIFYFSYWFVDSSVCTCGCCCYAFRIVILPWSIFLMLIIFVGICLSQHLGGVWPNFVSVVRKKRIQVWESSMYRGKRVVLVNFCEIMIIRKNWCLC